MGNINYYQNTIEDLERAADTVKICILSALVKEGLLKKEQAEEWCENHTLIMRKRNIFRTLTDKFIKTKPTIDGHIYITVKKIV